MAKNDQSGKIIQKGKKTAKNGHISTPTFESILPNWVPGDYLPGRRRTIVVVDRGGEVGASEKLFFTHFFFAIFNKGNPPEKLKNAPKFVFLGKNIKKQFGAFLNFSGGFPFVQGWGRPSRGGGVWTPFLLH